MVILRLRGKEDVGSTLIEVMQRYAASLQAVDSRFMLVTDSDQIPLQLSRHGAIDVIGEDNIYRGTEWVGETLRRAYDDAQAWVADAAADDEGGPPGHADDVVLDGADSPDEA